MLILDTKGMRGGLRGSEGNEASYDADILKTISITLGHSGLVDNTRCLLGPLNG